MSSYTPPPPPPPPPSERGRVASDQYDSKTDKASRNRAILIGALLCGGIFIFLLVMGAIAANNADDETANDLLVEGVIDATTTTEEVTTTTEAPTTTTEAPTTTTRPPTTTAPPPPPVSESDMWDLAFMMAWQEQTPSDQELVCTAYRTYPEVALDMIAESADPGDYAAMRAAAERGFEKVC